MNTRRKVIFVNQLCKAISKEVNQQIRDGRIPKEWDGHELRALLAHRFSQSTQMSIITREPRGKRARDFKNTVLVNNL